jgi:hypothetical protein
MQAKNGSPSAEKPLLHAPPARPDDAKTVVRLMEKRFLVALSVTRRTPPGQGQFCKWYIHSVSLGESCHCEFRVARDESISGGMAFPPVVVPAYAGIW